jgi:ribonuclease VapC
MWSLVVIAVDTSALIAIALNEPSADACIAALEAESDILISAANFAEVLVVAARRNVGPRVRRVLDQFDLVIVPVAPETARFVGEIYSRWGKSFHPAALNFGDCFAYALAKERGCPLLYVGEDFAKTDIVSAL